MKHFLLKLLIITLSISLTNCSEKIADISSFPHTTIKNEEIKMKVFLPDAENGVYRGTRFDWSGIIGSLKYKDHEYFGYWKKTHDPYFHEDLPGPVEGSVKPGLGYDEAKAGGQFIRLGVGIIEKEDESEFNWRKTYKILDHGKWNIEQGQDWILFTHELNSDIGYSYVYSKKIQLNNDGFIIEHKLKNNGEKVIETDQFNHNFFVIDNERIGPSFKITFPYNISTINEPQDHLIIDGNEIAYNKELKDGNTSFLMIKGFGDAVSENAFSVVNTKSNAGVNFKIDKALHSVVYWACETTLCPENSILLSVAPGEEEFWNSEYTFFIK